jgi:hypothetical protein
VPPDVEIERAENAEPAGFVFLRPGDLLLHPRTNAPIAKVISCSHKTTMRKKRPDKHTVTIVCEDL